MSEQSEAEERQVLIKVTEAHTNGEDDEPLIGYPIQRGRP